MSRDHYRKFHAHDPQRGENKNLSLKLRLLKVSIRISLKKEKKESAFSKLLWDYVYPKVFDTYFY